MLYSQIPGRLRNRLAKELKLDLKVLSISLRQDTPNDTRFSKLGLVTKYLDANTEIGTVDRPEAYVRGTLPMSWGVASTRSAGSGADGELVYFSGETERTLVALGGSAKHLIGHGSPSSPALSIAPVLLEALGGPQAQVSDDVATVAAEAQFGAPEHLEFLARRLVVQPSAALRSEAGGKAVLLGSPIYVALAEGG
jgi:hypothetical protein